jgi:hypothetical protein
MAEIEEKKVRWLSLLFQIPNADASTQSVQDVERVTSASSDLSLAAQEDGVSAVYEAKSRLSASLSLITEPRFKHHF